jgi:hypothetical protein
LRPKNFKSILPLAFLDGQKVYKNVLARIFSFTLSDYHFLGVFFGGGAVCGQKFEQKSLNKKIFLIVHIGYFLKIRMFVLISNMYIP